jgi:hypothetical protein
MEIIEALRTQTALVAALRGALEAGVIDQAQHDAGVAQARLAAQAAVAGAAPTVPPAVPPAVPPSAALVLSTSASLSAPGALPSALVCGSGSAETPPTTADGGGQRADPSRVPGNTADADAPGVTVAQRRALAKPRRRAPAVVAHGVRSILECGVTREITLRSGEVVPAGVKLNYGRLGCQYAPAGCTFRGDFLAGVLSHQQHCTYSGGAGRDAAPRAARAAPRAAGGAGGAAGGAAEEEDAPLPSDSGDDSGQREDERAERAPKRRRRAAGEPDGRAHNCGAPKRKRYTYTEKAEALDAVAAGQDAETVAAQLGVSPSNISAWKKLADEIYDAAGDARRKNLLGDTGRKGGRTARWPAMEAELLVDIKKLRARGRHLSLRWLRVRSRQIYDVLYPEHAGTFMASRSWRRRFMKRSNLVRRKKTNSKRKPVDERLPKIRIWHAKLARMLKRTARGASASNADGASGAGEHGTGVAGARVDEKWGM